MNGIFPTVQTPEPTLFALSVWAHMHTMSMPAMHPEHGMDSMQQWPRGRKMRYTCRKATPPSAWNSNEPKVVPATNTTADTFALDVVKNLTELIPVLKHRKLEALTPYHPEVWEHKL